MGGGPVYCRLEEPRIRTGIPRLCIQAEQLSFNSIEKEPFHMDCQTIQSAQIAAFKEHLRAEERVSGTIDKYLRDMRGFAAWLGERPLNKEACTGWKERLALLMETICATGIRVSEVRYITAEAVERGRAEISLKGKIRTILLPGKLCRKLQKYARKQKIVSGEIFLTRNGKGLSRRQIWAEMKSICDRAGVAASKVFPHNLRHLFARAFYQAYRDVVKLADVLGHSSIETTRIYLISTGAEHARQMDRLGLIT